MKGKAVSGLLLILLLIGILILHFNIQPVKSDYTWTETIYIRADGSIHPTTAPISTVDNVTYTLTDNVGDVGYWQNAIVVERDSIIIDGVGHTLQGTRGRLGIDLKDRNNVTLKNIEVTNFNYGIALGFSSNNTLANNTVSDNNFGIQLGLSTNNVLTGNTVSSNHFRGIELSGSSDNVLTSNTASNNNFGIHLVSSSYNVLTGNNVSNNTHGILLTDSSNNNYLTGNDASSSIFSGIELMNCSDNLLTGNTALNNENGIYLLSSSNNTFFHNTLINNTKQVTSYYSMNTWDDGYPSGGNYWSDYEERYPNATKIDNSGIWDTPYVIDTENQDNYPLMNPWTPEEEGSPFWMQWWFWTIIAIAIIALVGTVYLLRKGKPPISTVPPLSSISIT